MITIQSNCLNRQHDPINKFRFSVLTVETAYPVMNNIKSKAVGCDEISIDMVKNVSPFAIEAITYLVNINWIFPQAWKKNIFRPVPKTSSLARIEYLRQISLVPAISKLLDNIVTNQLTGFTNESHILPKLQPIGVNWVQKRQ